MAENERLPDYRNCLYWNPKVDFQSDTAEFAFYTSDDAGDYLIVVEGIGENGDVCREIVPFVVK